MVPTALGVWVPTPSGEGVVSYETIFRGDGGRLGHFAPSGEGGLGTQDPHPLFFIEPFPVRSAHRGAGRHRVGDGRCPGSSGFEPLPPLSPSPSWPLGGLLLVACFDAFGVAFYLGSDNRHAFVGRKFIRLPFFS